MSTTFAALDTPSSGVGAATSLSTIGPATFFLVGATSARPIYALEVSTDGVTFKPITALQPGKPYTLENAPLVSCRMRVLSGEDSAAVVVGYTDALSSQSVTSFAMPLGFGGSPGAAQDMPANQTLYKVMVVEGFFDGFLILEGEISTGVFAPVLQVGFAALDEFSVSVFPFEGIFESLRVRLTGAGAPTVKVGASSETTAAGGLDLNRANRVSDTPDEGQPYRIPILGLREAPNNRTSLTPQAVLIPAGTISKVNYSLVASADRTGSFSDITIEAYKNGILVGSLLIPGPVVPGAAFAVSGVMTLSPAVSFNGTTDEANFFFSGDMLGDGILTFELLTFAFVS